MEPSDVTFSEASELLVYTNNNSKQSAITVTLIEFIFCYAPQFRGKKRRKSDGSSLLRIAHNFSLVGNHYLIVNLILE